MSKSIPHTELCDLLNECDNIATKATIRYLKIHNLTYLKDRLIYEYSADFEVIRPLRDVWIKLLDFDSLKFVEFYEGVYRFRKVPRYENIFIMVLMSIASGIAANALYYALHERYKVWRRKNKINEKTHDKFSNSSSILFEYLTKIYAIREAYFHRKISYEKFNEIKDFLRRKIIIGEAKESDTNTEKEFTDLWNKFVQNHSLPPLNQSIDEIKDIVKSEYESQSTSPLYRRKSNSYPVNGILLHATAASPGVVYGMIKIINSIEDLDKTLNGDIGVFNYFTPEMIPCIKRCIGSIGLQNGGGITGHLAIISRALGIPCIVCCDYNKFADGQIVCLDGNKGDIQIILNIEEIKKCFNEYTPP